MSCSVAKLIAETVSMNEIGVPVSTETARQIYVFEKSVTGTEWHEAGRHGINPAVCLITPRCNYAGEKIAEYEGVRYGIYRTYIVNDEIELYLEKKGGVHEESNS